MSQKVGGSSPFLCPLYLSLHLSFPLFLAISISLSVPLYLSLWQGFQFCFFCRVKLTRIYGSYQTSALEQLLSLCVFTVAFRETLPTAEGKRWEDEEEQLYLQDMHILRKHQCFHLASGTFLET